MKIRFKKEYLIGLSFGLIIILLDLLYFLNTRWFFAMMVLSISISMSQFLLDLKKEQDRQKEIEEKFLEFVRALVGTVKSGISIPQALRQTSDKDYGMLTKYTKKLANQLEWGIPVDKALTVFSKDTGNTVIKRSVSIVLEAEKSGGDMESVLESVTDSVMHVKKMKAERKSETYSQMVEGYIIFFVFIGIMLLLQLKLFPALESVGSMKEGISTLGMGSVFEATEEKASLDRVFFSLILIQGFFAGIMIGKFSEGTLKQGIMHAFALTTIAALIITTVKGGI